MDGSAVVLHKLLTEQNLDLWAKLKLSFIDPAYSSVYSAIARHYNKYNNLPTFEDLEISLREGSTSKTVAALKLIEVTEIDAEVAIDALLDQYTQNETIKLLDRFVDKLPLYDTQEIKDNLGNNINRKMIGIQIIPLNNEINFITLAYFMKKVNCKCVIITQSEKGVTGCVDRPDNIFFIPPYSCPDVRCVIGAGDAFIAFLSLSIANGLSYEKASKIAFNAGLSYVKNIQNEPVNCLD